MSTRSVLFLHGGLSSFVEGDLHLLRRHAAVDALEYRGRRDLPRLGAAVAAHDVTFAWFVLGYAAAAVALAKPLRKGTVLVAAGWDVAAEPDLQYGRLLHPRLVLQTRFALENADVVLAVSEFTRKEVLRLADRHVAVVPHMIDSAYFAPWGKKEDLIVTVGGVLSESQYRVKGLRAFYDAARRLPHVAFAHVGGHAPEWEVRLRSEAPPNLRLTGKLSRDELQALYRRAKVIAQLSARESFGVAVAEGMASGCVPIVTDRGALPEVVGDTGLCVPYDDPAAAAEAFARALATDLGSAARQRVVEHFSPALRERRLLEAIGPLLA